MAELTSFHADYYGWTAKAKPDPERCAKQVAHGWTYAQCARKRGHGPEGAFCKQHAASLRATTTTGDAGQ